MCQESEGMFRVSSLALSLALFAASSQTSFAFLGAPKLSAMKSRPVLRNNACSTKMVFWSSKSKYAEENEKIVKPLMKANKKWIKEKKSQDPEFFTKLGQTHKPEVYWIGSSDSRLAANEIIGAEPGEVFVSRNMANIVSKHDINLMSALQYAVDYLEVPHIIVCGHYSCSGVRAALNNENFASPLENWVAQIREVYRIHAEELEAIEDKEERLRKLVECNVIESCRSVYDLTIVQNRLKATSQSQLYATPRIHALVYDVASGELKRLNWVDPDMEDPYEMKYDLEQIRTKPLEFATL